VEAVTAPVATAAPAAPTRGPPKPEVTCFRCRAKGHKAPDCPSRPKSNRRVRLPENEPLELNEEELFGAVNGFDTCITVDTGAQISVVPKQFVLSTQWMGNVRKVKAFQGTVVEGEECSVEFKIGGRTFSREAVAVDGELIHWTPCFRVPLASEDMLFMVELAKEKDGKEVQLYHPPRMVEKESETPDEELQGLMDIDLGKEIEKGTRSSSECAEESGDHGSVAEEIREVASGSVEVDGGLQEGSADEGSLVIEVEGIKNNRGELINEMKTDSSLKVARELASREALKIKFVCPRSTDNNVCP